MKRTKHNLSNYKLASFDLGGLYPVGLLETLPGDTIQQSTSMLLRMSPMVAPVMHPISVRIHHWFVPHRLVFPEFEDFITGGNDGLGEGSVWPTNAAPLVVAKNSLADYMGVPPETYLTGDLSLVPFRGYNLIYNEFYRDQDLVTEVDEDAIVVQPIAWEKDYFTTARPWTQRGPEVTVPIGANAPVILDPTNFNAQKFKTAAAHTPYGTSETVGVEVTSGDLEGTISGTDLVLDPNGTLIADLASATSANINEFRRAFALQRYQEARAQYGARYTEYLRYLGIRSSDSRLARPEFLGGGKQTMSISEVLSTTAIGPTGNAMVGGLGGHGIAAARTNRYRYFCEEHGYIFTLLSLRPRTMYINGIDRHWSRRTKEDHFQKELELVGQQEIFNRELFYEGAAADEGVFGYQDRYAEYRHQRSTIAGDFRDTLNYWHLARSFASLPALNSSFINSDPARRIFVISTAGVDTMYGMISHSVQARRLVGSKTIGRII